MSLWARLGAMTWGEVPHRVREQWRRQIDRSARPPRAAQLATWPVEIGLTVAQFAVVWQWADRCLEEGEPDWAHCPRTGHRWGAGHAFDIDLFCGVDPRASWSQHRLRDVQLLAVAGAAGHARAERLARSRTLGWIRANPPVNGLGWASGIEVACRVVSLLIVSSTVASEWTDAERVELADAIEAHRWYLQRYPSVGSSANNHAVAELGARVVLGEDVRQAFCEAFVSMVRPDGSGVEEAPAYLAACVEWALVVRASAGLTADAEARLLAATRFLGGLVDGLGRSPAFGDDDGDALLAGPRERWLFEVAGMGASALGRLDLCPIGWTAELRAALAGVLFCEGSRPVGSGEVGGGLVRLAGGTAVVWLDRGRLGMPPMSAHGHADALSVVIHLGGRPVVVDTGTGTYLGDLVWRRHARSAGAHNSVVVDDRDPVVQRGPFQWAPEPDGLWERVWSTDNEAGGRWSGWGVVHERSVRIEDGVVVIEDRIEGEGSRRLALPLHFAPGLSLVADEHGWSVFLGTHRVAEVRMNRAAELQTGSVSVRYGSIEEAPRLVSEFTVDLPWSSTVRIGPATF